jgi:hypothetical protein
MRSALILGLGGTGGRVLDHIDAATVGGKVYIDAFDDGWRTIDDGTSTLWLGDFPPGQLPSRRAARATLAAVSEQLACWEDP